MSGSSRRYGVAIGIVMIAIGAALLLEGPFGISHLIAFVAVVVVLGAIMRAAMGRRQEPATPPAVAADNVVPMQRDVAAPSDSQRQTMTHQELARALERAAAEQLERQRQAARSSNDDEDAPGPFNGAKRGNTKSKR